MYQYKVTVTIPTDGRQDDLIDGMKDVAEFFEQVVKYAPSIAPIGPWRGSFDGITWEVEIVGI